MVPLLSRRPHLLEASYFVGEAEPEVRSQVTDAKSAVISSVEL
jgi:hypothetical protein